jgi:hypothetical protein
MVGRHRRDAIRFPRLNVVVRILRSFRSSSATCPQVLPFHLPDLLSLGAFGGLGDLLAWPWPSPCLDASTAC